MGDVVLNKKMGAARPALTVSDPLPLPDGRERVRRSPSGSGMKARAPSISSAFTFLTKEPNYAKIYSHDKVIGVWG